MPPRVREVARLLRLQTNLARRGTSSQRHFAAAVPQKPGLLRSPLKLGVICAAGGGVALYAVQSPSFSENAKLGYLIPTRLARNAWTAAHIIADYRLSLSQRSAEDKRQALQQCHQRSANRLLNLCFKNGGVYIKLGQHLGQLDHLLPPEYVLTMRQHLLDKCPVSSYSEVVHIFQEDFGARPEQLFAKFDPQPLASASLAQVHAAEDVDGRKFAVKVQHPTLREACNADLATIRALVKAARWMFPDFDYQWLVHEIETNLPRELDFQHEASNAQRCARNLSSRRSRVRGRVHIPSVDGSRTSHRVLTMEYVQGLPVTDAALLRRHGLDPGAVARLIAETFSEMIFIHGDVHCDPHAANLMVRERNGKPQLILLDHGLYRQMDDAFRLEYASLWRALIFADVEAIKKHSQNLNAGDAYPLFAGLLTQRPWKEVSNNDHRHLHVPEGDANRELLQDYAQRYAPEINSLLLRMPQPMLMLLKTTDCLRAVDKCLGQPINTFLITAQYCNDAVTKHDLATHRGVVAWLRVRLSQCRIQFRLLQLRIATWIDMHLVSIMQKNTQIIGQM